MFRLNGGGETEELQRWVEERSGRADGFIVYIETSEGAWVCLEVNELREAGE